MLKRTVIDKDELLPVIYTWLYLWIDIFYKSPGSAKEFLIIATARLVGCSWFES